MVVFIYASGTMERVGRPIVMSGVISPGNHTFFTVEHMGEGNGKGEGATYAVLK